MHAAWMPHEALFRTEASNMNKAISRHKKGFWSKAKVGTVNFRFGLDFVLRSGLFMVVIRLFRQSDVFGMVQEIDGCYDSLWQSTAVLAPETRSLTESKRCDVAIVGAGFTGLNAAIGLAEAGHSVCVLDAKHLGFGASGRSGGQVNMGLNLGPSELIKLYGREQGERTTAMMRSTPDMLFDRHTTRQFA